MRRLEHELGRSPIESEIAAELDITLAEYQTLLSKVQGTQLVYLEDMTRSNDDEDNFLDRHVADSEADPLNMLRDQRLRQALVTAIKALPEREQLIMSMYYEQDMNLKEIAAVMSTCSQSATSAASRSRLPESSSANTSSRMRTGSSRRSVRSRWYAASFNPSANDQDSPWLA